MFLTLKENVKSGNSTIPFADSQFKKNCYKIKVIRI